MKIAIFILFLLYNGIVFANSVVAEGEAVIKNNDNESARSIALLRAKWSAVESVSPAKVKVESIINNSKIIDEAIKTELTATISSFTIIEEKIVDNKYIIKINANVIENNSLCFDINFHLEYDKFIVDFSNIKLLDNDTGDTKDLKFSTWETLTNSGWFKEYNEIISRIIEELEELVSKKDT